MPELAPGLDQNRQNRIGLSHAALALFLDRILEQHT
jgi:hypothetical protein